MIDTTTKNSIASVYTAAKAYATTIQQEIQAIQVVVRPGQSGQNVASITLQFKPGTDGVTQSTETLNFPVGE